MHVRGLEGAADEIADAAVKVAGTGEARLATREVVDVQVAQLALRAARQGAVDFAVDAAFDLILIFWGRGQQSLFRSGCINAHTISILLLSHFRHLALDVDVVARKHLNPLL